MASEDAAAARYDCLDDADRREFLRAVNRELVVKGRTVELVLADLGHDGGSRFALSVLPEADTTTPGRKGEVAGQ